MEKRTDEELKRDLTFDNYSRYAVLRDIINFNRRNNREFKILDIGGRGNKLREFLPKDEVFYLDPGVETGDKNFIKGDGCNIPLEDESFDWVVSAEVFEHIEKKKKETFLSENIRVAKLGMILTAPFYSKEVYQEEIEANRSYKKFSGKDYLWLKEHFDRGLPSEKETETFFKEKGHSFQKLHGNRTVLWQKLIEMGFLVSCLDDEWARERLKKFNYFYNSEVYPRDFFEPSHRKIYFVKKKENLKNLEIKSKPIDDKLILEVMKKSLDLSLDLTSQIAVKNNRLLLRKERIIQQKNEKLLEFDETKNTLRWRVPNYFYSAYRNKIKKYIPKSIFKIKDERIVPGVSSFRSKIKELDLRKIKARILREDPKITIGIASYNHSKYLKQCIDSALRQDYKKVDVVIVDDNSSDSKNKEILKSYENRSNVQVIYKKENEGISESLNTQVIKARGDWMAFMDCDDYLPKDALLKVARYLKSNPKKKMIYSNRIEVDEGGSFLKKVWFGGRAKNPNVYEEFKKGMVSSHLKVIHKDVFLKVGLFDQRFGGTHDYDFFLRSAFYFPETIGFVNEYLYYHRIHSKQNTKIDEEKHRKSAQLFKEETAFREKVYSGKFEELISFIILSFNRGEQLKKTIDSILKFGKNIKKQIIILDNDSNDEKTLSRLKEMDKLKDVQVIFSEKNLRCPGGRKFASKLAKGEYCLYLDNDIEIKEGTIEELILRVNESDKIGGACCKVIFPDKLIQFNGGEFKLKDGFISYALKDKGKAGSDLSAMLKSDCDWIPGGATIFKKECFSEASFDDGYLNAYSDLDLSFQIKESGYRVVNCPNALVIHYHITHVPMERGKGSDQYKKTRHNEDAFIRSWIHFYKKWNLIVDDKFILDIVGLQDKGKKQIKEYVESHAREE